MPRAIELIVRSLALHDEAAIDRDDLRLLTPKQRLEGLEALRRAYFGYGDNPPRLERVLERASLGEHKVSSDWSPRPRLPRRSSSDYFHGVELDIIGRSALLKNKRASGRRKDLVDVALLEQAGDDARNAAPSPRVRVVNAPARGRIVFGLERGAYRIEWRYHGDASTIEHSPVVR